MALAASENRRGGGQGALSFMPRRALIGFQRCLQVHRLPWKPMNTPPLIRARSSTGCDSARVGVQPEPLADVCLDGSSFLENSLPLPSTLHQNLFLKRHQLLYTISKKKPKNPINMRKMLTVISPKNQKKKKGGQFYSHPRNKNSDA